MQITNLPFPKWKRGPSHAIDHILGNELFIEQWIVPKGTAVRLMTTTNFGWIVLPEHCLDVRGFAIPKRIFKF